MPASCGPLHLQVQRDQGMKYLEIYNSILFGSQRCLQAGYQNFTLLWRKWEFQVKGGPLGILTLLRITLFPTACALRWLHLHNHQNEKSQVPSFSFLGGESSQSCSSQNHYPWSIFHLQHSKYFLILLVKKQKIDGRVRPKIKRLFLLCFLFRPSFCTRPQILWRARWEYGWEKLDLP